MEGLLGNARYMLENTLYLRQSLRKGLIENPKFYKPRQETLKMFFSSRSLETDICFILSGGIYSANQFAPHITDDNSILFRPKSSHKHKISFPFHSGELHPERDLIFVDEDLVSGASLRESREYFVERGYDPNKMFAYLDLGRKSSPDEKNTRVHELFQLEDNV